jgi:hypothetical protein
VCATLVHPTLHQPPFKDNLGRIIVLVHDGELDQGRAVSFCRRLDKASCGQPAPQEGGWSELLFQVLCF